MSSRPLVPPELLGAPRNRWDLAVEVLLAATLVLLPVAFGGVDAFSELAALALVGAAAVVVLLRTAVDRTFAPPRSWTYLPLAALLALAALQAISWPAAWVAWASPQSVALRQDLLSDLPPATDSDPAARSAISLYPPATWHSLRLLLIGAGVYFVTLATVRTAPQITRLLTIVLGIGAAQAALALLQIFTRADKIYWVVDAGTDRVTSGSFVNYSNFSQFMNLSIGAGLALLLIRLHEPSAPRRSERDLFGPSFLSAHGAVLTALVLCAVSVLTSLSRNGAIAMVAAAAVVGAALYVRGTLSRQGWIVAMLPLAALAAALVFGFDAVYRRLATLSDTDQLASRWEMAEGALRAWREFPLWGAGLGTHEYVFPMFDRSVSPQLAAHADNDYVQLLEEAGLLGAACLAAFFAIIAVLAVRTGCRGRTSLSAGALGPAFGLVAVAIHSATDFGQRLPAVFCLTAVSCALIVRLDRIERRAAAETLRRPLPFALRRAHAAVGLVAVGAALWWALGQTYAAYLGEQWWAAAYEIENEIRTARQDAQDQQYADLLAATEQAATLQPRNVAYAYALNLYRWQALVASLAANAEPPGAAAAFQDVVQRLADELSAVRRLAPTYGPPYGLEGQLRWLVLEQPRGQRLIDLGTKLAPYDPATCLIAAEMKAREDHAADAERLLRRAVALDAGLFPDAAGMALDILSDPQLATELADGRYERLQWLADQATRREELAPHAPPWRAAALASLRRRAELDEASPAELARLAAEDAGLGEFDAAAELYRRALQLSYGRVEWRLERARALAAAGRTDEALDEARRCLRLRPEFAAAEQLAAELSAGNP